MRGSEVKIEKVYNSTEAQPVDDVAHGTAGDQPDRDGEEGTRSAAQPVDQERDDNSGSKGKDQRIHSGAAVEQAKADAAIIGQGEIEERRHGLAVAETAPGDQSKHGGFAEPGETCDDSC